MKKNFETFLSSLSTTNATLDYFTDFEKAHDNVQQIELHLNQLNYLLGKTDLRSAVRYLYQKAPEAFSILEILIAVRSDKRVSVLDDNGDVVPLVDYLHSAEGVMEFLEKTGLAQVFQDRQIKNLVDYVFGVEVGLDSNARKNRGGDNMSKAVSQLFESAGIHYAKEVRHTLFPEIQSLGVDVKQFDFVVRSKKRVYLIEVNYYNSSGSKLNEVARAYSELAPKINQYPGYSFVWITDGQGWYSAKSKLEEAYKLIPEVYNLSTLQTFITKVKKEGVLPT